MEFLKQYFPIILIGSWFFYKWINIRNLKKKLPELKRKGALLIDVRSAQEYAQGHIPGTLNIPLDELHKKASSLPAHTPLVLACASGNRSGMAKMLLKRKGFKEVYNIGTWTNLGA